jgi:hypothetical protein
MEQSWIIYLGSLALAVVLTYIFILNRRPSEDQQAQKLLDEYLEGNLSSTEIGTFYERYIGHLYEEKGYYVKYHGAVNGVEDLGRDLIVKSDDEILIIQTKCWAKFKVISEKYIFQLYGSMTHYKKTEKCDDKNVRAIFYTTANFSDVAIEAAKVLGIELVTKELDRTYPLIKCNINQKGEKIYHLPFDPYYDKIRIDSDEGKVFVHTVQEAVARGFRRARNKNDKAA